MSEITVGTLHALQSFSGVGCAISIACARDILEDVLEHLEHLLHGFLLSFFHGLSEGSIRQCCFGSMVELELLFLECHGRVRDPLSNPFGGILRFVTFGKFRGDEGMEVGECLVRGDFVVPFSDCVFVLSPGFNSREPEG